MASSFFNWFDRLTPFKQVALIFAVYCICFLALEPLKIKLIGIDQPTLAYSCYEVVSQALFFTLLFHWRTVKQLFRKKQAGSSPLV